eukprot:TRINITY_DN651_c1_g1_i2.p2 TRINITY_DN651_c1_g1~~TRINITY_DN651_c1_g1_i2.p2  ORF type:complete len:154 (-),score=22.55 TRINITY_DN651_c1_g1_i2:485-946(-)
MLMGASGVELGPIDEEAEQQAYVQQVKENLQNATNEQIATAAAIQLQEEADVQNATIEILAEDIEQQLTQGEDLQEAISVVLVQDLGFTYNPPVAAAIAFEFTPRCTLSGSSCPSRDRAFRFIYISGSNSCVRRRVCKFEGFPTRRECNDNCK